MSIKVSEQTVYSDRDLPADEASPEVRYKKSGKLSKSDMIDREIEADEHRLGLPDGEGDISITVQPGEQLGEFSINVQFEGPKGAYNFCMEQQNDLLLHASDWLREILEDFRGDFEVRIESQPCPKAEEKVEIASAARVLTRRARLNEVLQRREESASVRSTSSSTHKVEERTTRSIKKK